MLFAEHPDIRPEPRDLEAECILCFDVTVLNDLDRFHLVMDTIDRVPRSGEKGIYLKQQLENELIEHKHGEDMPEIQNWKWDSQQ
jgi:xylulose-5-phosphate/fructose-6-phosphate phosphoketolase